MKIKERLMQIAFYWDNQSSDKGEQIKTVMIKVSYGLHRIDALEHDDKKWIAVFVKNRLKTEN
jgi:hypothetical protein